MPYYVFAYRNPGFEKWEWGSAAEGFPNTAPNLRAAVVKNPYMKVLVMEGFYDLATPFDAAEYVVDHLDLMPNLRKNISLTTYECGHMVYVRMESLAKMKQDFSQFLDRSLPPQ